MILALDVVGMLTRRIKVFYAHRGTIGGLPDNDLVLFGPSVSRRHAVIRYAHGVFDLEAASAAPVFINAQLLGRDSYTLETGDVIRIGGYSLRVHIDAHAEDAADRSFRDDAAGAVYRMATG